MVFLFNSIIALGILGIFASRRKPDLLDLSFAGLVIFSLPLVFGKLVQPGDFRLLTIHTGSYAVMVIPLSTLVTAILIRAIVQPAKRFRSSSFQDIEPNKYETLYYIALGFLVMIIIRDLSDIWHIEQMLSKTEMNRLTGGIGSLFFINALSPFCMAWAASTRKYFSVIVIFCIVLIQATVFQSRSAFVFVLIALAFTCIKQSNLSGLRIKAIMVFLMCFALATTVTYKTIKGRLLRGMWDTIPPITGAEFWLDVVNHFEPNKATFMLNGVVSQQIEFGVEHFFFSLARLIPFSQTIFDYDLEKWGHVVKVQIFGHHQGGFANNIWAEIFSVAGLGGVFFAAIFWVIGIIFVQTLISNRRLWVSCMGMIFVPHWCFFILRVSLGSTVSYIANSFLLIGCIFVTAMVIRSLLVSLKVAIRERQSAQNQWTVSKKRL